MAPRKASLPLVCAYKSPISLCLSHTHTHGLCRRQYMSLLHPKPKYSVASAPAPLSLSSKIAPNVKHIWAVVAFVASSFSSQFLARFRCVLVCVCALERVCVRGVCAWTYTLYLGEGGTPGEVRQIDLNCIRFAGAQFSAVRDSVMISAAHFRELSEPASCCCNCWSCCCWRGSAHWVFVMVLLLSWSWTVGAILCACAYF